MFLTEHLYDCEDHVEHSCRGWITGEGDQAFPFQVMIVKHGKVPDFDLGQVMRRHFMMDSLHGI